MSLRQNSKTYRKSIKHDALFTQMTITLILLFATTIGVVRLLTLDTAYSDSLRDF
ncbi:MAG: hypothetical protein Q9P01_04085 [Anaerolineae bacterium]|nr:hypothetical protein [Anaerolineae bacterium]